MGKLRGYNDGVKHRAVPGTILWKSIPLILISSYILLAGNRIEIIDHTSALNNGPADIVVAQVSDLHFGKKPGRIHRRAAGILKRINPDILVITGDSIGDEKDLPALGQWLDSVDIARHHRFATLGNWEYLMRNPEEQLDGFYADHDVQLLVNEFADMEIRGRTIRITGLDDYLHGSPDYRLPGNAGNRVKEIILIHEPAAANVLAGRVEGADILSGHTHGGQITLLGQAVYTPPGSGRFIAGAYEVGGNRLFVSKGIGTSSINLRIGPNPDIVVLSYSECPPPCHTLK